MRAAGNVPPPHTLISNSKDRLFWGIGLDEYSGSISRLRDKFLERGMDVFDGLEDPYHEFEFNVRTADGRLQPRMLSTAQMLSLSREGWNDATSMINRTLNNLKEGGFITDQKTTPWSNRIDQRVYQPQLFLNIFPWITAPYTPQPSQVMSILPRPKRVPYLALTQKAYDPAMLPDQAIIDAMTALRTGIVGLHSSSNSNVCLSPAVFISNSPPQGAKELNIRDNGAPRSNVRITDYPPDYPPWSLQMDKFFTLNSPDSARPDMVITGPTLSHSWQVSLQQRKLYIEHYGDIDYTFTPIEFHSHTNVCSDAMTDFAQLIALASFLLNVKSHVLMHSCAQFHRMLLERAFQNLNIPFGSDLDQYKLAMESEANMRENIAVSNAMSVLETGFGLTAAIAGKNEQSQSQARDNLSASTVGTLPLGVAAVIAKPNIGIPCALISGVAALGVYMNSDRAPNAHRETFTIVDDSLAYNNNRTDRYQNTNWYSHTFQTISSGYTPSNIIYSMPVLQVPN